MQSNRLSACQWHCTDIQEVVQHSQTMAEEPGAVEALPPLALTSAQVRFALEAIRDAQTATGAPVHVSFRAIADGVERLRALFSDAYRMECTDAAGLMQVCQLWGVHFEATAASDSHALAAALKARLPPNASYAPIVTPYAPPSASSSSSSSSLSTATASTTSSGKRAAPLPPPRIRDADLRHFAQRLEIAHAPTATKADLVRRVRDSLQAWLDEHADDGAPLE